MRSARTRSRNATRSASPGRASSTTSWSRTCKDLALTMQEGVPHRRERPARARCWSTSRRTSPATSARFEYPKRVSMRSYNPVVQGAPGPDQEGAAAAAGGRAADDLHRRRRDPGQRVEGAEPARRPARVPVHQHLDGAGRLPGERPEVRRHAGHARHLRGQHGDAALRRAGGHRRALRRPRDRQSEAFRAEPAQDHPHRRRSVVDLQAGARSTCRSSATCANA